MMKLCRAVPNQNFLCRIKKAVDSFKTEFDISVIYIRLPTRFWSVTECLAYHKHDFLLLLPTHKSYDSQFYLVMFQYRREKFQSTFKIVKVVVDFIYGLEKIENFTGVKKCLIQGLLTVQETNGPTSSDSRLKFFHFQKLLLQK